VLVFVAAVTADAEIVEDLVVEEATAQDAAAALDGSSTSIAFSIVACLPRRRFVGAIFACLPACYKIL
jgi:hypothetical protein